MKWLLIGLGALATLILTIFVAGSLRPASHTASVTAELPVSPDSVWRIISDVEAQPRWLPLVSEVKRLPDDAGRPSYLENFDGFEATTVITESSRPTRLVKEILPTGPFYGSWTWELSPSGTGTRLVITERGTVDNAFFRGMMVFQDYQKSLRDYVAALERRIRT